MVADFKQGTALTGGILYANQLGGTTTTLLTVAANTAVKIASASCVNVSGATTSLTVYVVPSGGSAGPTNMVISAYPVTSGSTVILDSLIGSFLGAGATVQALASTASALNLTITGVTSS